MSGERDAARLDLLSQLATARGQDLLQESQGQRQGGLLFSLEATQSKAKEIAVALEESRQSLNEVARYFESFSQLSRIRAFRLGYLRSVVSLFLRRAKDHEKFARFAANVYETVKGLTLLSPLYVVSAEAYTDICLKAVQGDSTSANEDREKKESQSLIEKRYVLGST